MITNENFNKLKDKYETNDVYNNNKWLHMVLYYLSYFGNMMSIFLAFFILSKILKGAINNAVIVYIISIVLLSGLELLKRFVFDKFSLQFLKNRCKIAKNISSLLLFSILISATSFIATLSGAKEMSSKQKVYTTEQNIKQDTYADSLNIVYNKKISEFERERTDNKSKINSKDEEQSTLANNVNLDRMQMARINDLKNDIKQLRIDNDNIDSNISKLKNEMADKIQAYNTRVGTETTDKKKENNTNVFWFVILSMLVEAVILIGVYYNEYYKYKSYKEYKDMIEKNPRFQQWFLYEQLMSIIFTEDLKINDKIPTTKALLDMCKINDISVQQKDINNFFKITTNLGIFKTSGSVRYVIKTKEYAEELIKKHFNI